MAEWYIRGSSSSHQLITLDSDSFPPLLARFHHDHDGHEDDHDEGCVNGDGDKEDHDQDQDPDQDHDQDRMITSKFPAWHEQLQLLLLCLAPGCSTMNTSTGSQWW